LDENCYITNVDILVKVSHLLTKRIKLSQKLVNYNQKLSLCVPISHC